MINARAERHGSLFTAGGAGDGHVGGAGRDRRLHVQRRVAVGPECRTILLTTGRFLETQVARYFAGSAGRRGNDDRPAPPPWHRKGAST